MRRSLLAAERDAAKAAVADLQSELHQTSLLLGDVQAEAGGARAALQRVREERDEALDRSQRAQRAAEALDAELAAERAAHAALQRAAELAEWHASHRAAAMLGLLQLGSTLDDNGGEKDAAPAPSCPGARPSAGGWPSPVPSGSELRHM
jgi:hypothetical protein